MVRLPTCTGTRSNMNTMTKGNQKHLTLSDRIYIEQGLCMGRNFKEIAEFLVKDATTISKEIKKYRIPNKPYRSLTNDCKRFKTCRLRGICNKMCGSRCSICKEADCRPMCKDYVSDGCDKLRKAPYVCNPCDGRQGCHKPHCYYRAQHAYSIYKKTLISSREGINRFPEEISRLD